MVWARQRKIADASGEVVVSTASDKTTMESIVAAQHSLKNVHELVKIINITILKIESILVSRAPKVSCLIYLPLLLCYRLFILLFCFIMSFFLCLPPTGTFYGERTRYIDRTPVALSDMCAAQTFSRHVS